MKKILVVVALALGCLTATAQKSETPQEEATKNPSSKTAQEGFTEIASNELPEAITATLSKDYPTSTIKRASVNEAEQYKLEIALDDGTEGTLYATKDGNWINM